MKTTSHITCLFLAAAGLVVAEVPREPGVTKYSNLWNDSPFTAKPPPDVGPAPNPLRDYVLLNVAPVPEGYIVTLLDTKRPSDPGSRITLVGNEETKGFRIVDVVYGKPGSSGTKAKIRTRDGQVGLVGFEEKYLALKSAPSATPAAATGPQRRPQNPNVRPNPNPGQQTRVPRRRIIPPKPPEPGANQRTNPGQGSPPPGVNR
ncbi:MAG: hypothetical protein R3242_07450 [Akkermansiaceae bacterium]|nr:hypothetical protein [Akkermansiaceae bacterium]